MVEVSCIGGRAHDGRERRRKITERFLISKENQGKNTSRRQKAALMDTCFIFGSISVPLKLGRVKY